MRQIALPRLRVVIKTYWDPPVGNRVVLRLESITYKEAFICSSSGQGFYTESCRSNKERFSGL